VPNIGLTSHRIFLHPGGGDISRLTWRRFDLLCRLAVV